MDFLQLLAGICFFVVTAVAFIFLLFSIFAFDDGPVRSAMGYVVALFRGQVDNRQLMASNIRESLFPVGLLLIVTVMLSGITKLLLAPLF